MYSSQRGRSLLSDTLDFDLLSRNNAVPTRISDDGTQKSNVDLIFNSPYLTQISNFNLFELSYSSDHIPISLVCDLSPSYVKAGLNRINIKRVDWTDFCSLMEEDTLPLVPDLLASSHPEQPLWWNHECVELLQERRLNYRRYQANQTLNARIEFRRRDAEISRKLRKIKSEDW